MCDFHQVLPPLDEDEYVLDVPLVRELVAEDRAGDVAGPRL